jgi:hypothetical protein
VPGPCLAVAWLFAGHSESTINIRIYFINIILNVPGRPSRGHLPHEESL